MTNVVDRCMTTKQKNKKSIFLSQPSVEEAIEQVRPWVEKGKAWAQDMLGYRYRDGVGVDQSYQQAKELFEMSASQGSADAQYELGILYQNGQGVDQSNERAAEYYEAAARQGNADAQYNLGIIYKDGLGVDQSYERAAEYLEAAAKQGDADAQHNLGILYGKGQGVEQSFETCRGWFIKAAEQGNEDAIKVLQTLDKQEGRTTPSFTPPKRCSTCNAPITSTHKLRNCKCKGAQYCNTKCQAAHWKSHQKEHHRLCKEMKLKKTEEE